MEESLEISRIKLLVIGGSAGGLDVLLKTLPHLPTSLPFAIVIVLHRKTADSTLLNLFSAKTELPIIEVADKEKIEPGTVYIAPADYHLLVETDHSLSLDYSEKVNYSRPSIDVTFQTAAEVYKTSLACLLLSGASADGAEGLDLVKTLGGVTAVQDPDTAEVPFMPRKALEKIKPDYIVKTNQVQDFVRELAVLPGTMG